MITLYGVTEDGVSVPVQVTADGRVVAQGLKGDSGQPGADSQVPGPQGPPGPQGEYGPGDDVVFGTGSFAEGLITIDADGDIGCHRLDATEAIKSQKNITSLGTVSGAGQTTQPVFRGYSDSLNKYTSTIWADGSADFVENKCGFNSDGELIFTSRGTRYRMIIQGNMLYPDPAPLTREEINGTTDIVFED